ncbi:MAG TPA: LysR family transcriptional regulator [Burkholderiales bacterium]|jgi:DNA-binding transcriptional LysR family regulator
MRLSLESLRLFVAIVETQSITAGAARVHTALAAASRRIRELEESLACELFHRRARGVELTAAGLALLPHARTVLEDASKLKSEMNQFARGVAGDVRLHVNTSSLTQFLPEDLTSFGARFPGIKIDLRESVSGAIVKALRDDEADIGIFAAGTPAGGLDVRIYRRDKLIVIVPRGHALARRRAVKLEALAEYDMVSLTSDTSLFGQIAEACEVRGITLRHRVQVRSLDAICRLVEAGLGIAILPGSAVSQHTPAMQLKAIALDEPWAVRELMIAVRDKRGLSATVLQLYEHLTAAEA